MSDFADYPSILISFGLSTLAGGLIGLYIFRKFFRGEGQKRLLHEDTELNDWEMPADERTRIP